MDTHKKSKDVSEERTAGASYVLTFYQDVAQLTHYYSQYLNLLIELEVKDDKKSAEQAPISEQDRAVLVQAIQNVRYYANKCFIEYACIARSLGQTIQPKIEEDYKSVTQQFIIHRVPLESYVIQMNTWLVGDIIKNLMETSQKIIDTIYNDS